MKEENEIVVDKELEEASTAAATLKPSNTTKSGELSKLMSAVAGMSKEDLSAFLTKTLAQVGKEDDSVPDNSGKNKSSIAMKPGKAPAPSAATGAASAMKEDVAELFGGQDLSEEFKEKTSTLFEAAVNNRLIIEMARIEEEYEAKLDEEVEKQVMESIDELHTQVEKYMDYVAEQWLERNELALENQLRTSITEQFIVGLKRLFQESYIDVPEDKFDVVTDMAAELATVQEALEQAKVRGIELENELRESNRDKIFSNCAADLTDTQAEKLKALAESVEYTDLDDYSEKLEIIKEQYFKQDGGENIKPSTGLINEDFVGSNDAAPEIKSVNPEMRSYVAALSRTIKK